MYAFLSHEGVDKPLAKRLAAQLTLMGSNVFLDEWNIGVGESIPGAINLALEQFDVFILLWSAAAESSSWVREEFHAGLTRAIEEGVRLACLRIDDTPVPSIVSHRRWIDMREGKSAADAIDELLGIKSPSERRMTIQAQLDEGGVPSRYFEGYGLLVGCPRCGAPVEELEGFVEEDLERDDVYAGARCRSCGWSDGGEI